MNDENIKIQVLMTVNNDDDFEKVMRAYQIDDFVNAINEMLDIIPQNKEIQEILKKHDILKFFN